MRLRYAAACRAGAADKAMQQIGPGSSSLYVRLAQHLLNSRLRRTAGFHRLREDGAFGPRSAAAVRLFQAMNHITSENGVVGPMTWRALGIAVEIDHRVTLRPQHYDMGCWAASAAMMLDRDMSVGTNGAELGLTRGLMPTVENVETFTRQFGWHVMSPPANVMALADILRGGPIWLAGSVILEDGSTGGHVMVISGAWGDGSAYGTYVRIHDPWPVNHGAISVCTYPGMVTADGLPFDPYMIAGPF
ncbi:MAG: papain-like cysteine protease family protein [Micropepsaceae bacterium]